MPGSCGNIGCDFNCCLENVNIVMNTPENPNIGAIIISSIAVEKYRMKQYADVKTEHAKIHKKKNNGKCFPLLIFVDLVIDIIPTMSNASFISFFS